jgi:hypothetical protein
MNEENDAKTSELSGQENNQNNDREEVYSKVVRAGNRTYFFDVKATRKNDLYLTITESKKRFNKDGKFFFEKHKIFLYKEDFDKFADGFEDAIGYIKEHLPEVTSAEDDDSTKKIDNDTPVSGDDFVNVEFEDLGEK